MTTGILSPYMFGDFGQEVCDHCHTRAILDEVDEEEGVEIYRCRCGELEYEEPIVEN